MIHVVFFLNFSLRTFALRSGESCCLAILKTIQNYIGLLGDPAAGYYWHFAVGRKKQLTFGFDQINQCNEGRWDAMHPVRVAR